MLSEFVEGSFEKISAVDARNFDRVLKGQKNAFPSALFGVKFEEVFALIKHFPLRDFITFAAS